MGNRRPTGSLMKRCPIDQTQQTQEHVSELKNKESEYSISCWMSQSWGIPVAEWSQPTEAILPYMCTQMLAHVAINLRRYSNLRQLPLHELRIARITARS